MSIIGDISGEVVKTVVTNPIESKIEEIKSSLDENKILKEVRSYLLSVYGKESYYDSLDKYISNNKIIEFLIANARATVIIGKEQFASEHTNRFLNDNEEYHSMRSHIENILMMIYEYIFGGINSISPYSDFGKLNESVLRGNSELSYQINAGNNIICNKLTELLSIVKTQQKCGTINGVANEEMKDCSDEVKGILDKIKEVEREYQRKYQFELALSKYFSILQLILTKFRGYPASITDELLCTLNCDIALCQSNLGNETEAINSLNQIDKKTAENNKTYYFVSAAIIVDNKNDYDEAIKLLSKALEIDPNYHRAFLFKQHLYAITGKQDYEQNISAVDERINSIKNESKDGYIIADYYIYRGMINLAYNHPEEAFQDFSQAEEYGYNDIIAKLNSYIALYQQVTLKIPKESFVPYPEIDFEKIHIIINGIKNIIESDKDLSCLNYSSRQNVMRIYLSSCSLIGVDHGLVPIEKYIKSYDDYEIRRILILNSRDKLTDDILNYLNENDRQYISLRILIDDRKFDEAKDIIVQTLEEKEKPIFLLHILMQACVLSQDVDTYWKYRDKIKEDQSNKNYFASLDACIKDAEGKTQEAKELFDELVSETRDYILLVNAERFYIRNGFESKAENVFLKICSLNKESQLYIENQYNFYNEALTFFRNKNILSF